jgi:POT family proton-dependent oligopeptide transporter
MGWFEQEKLDLIQLINLESDFFLAAGFFLFYSLRYFAGADGKSSLNLFTFTWLVITFGELCLGPIGCLLLLNYLLRRCLG